MINIKDANGIWVCIQDEDFMEILTNRGFTIYDLTLDEIVELKTAYDLHGGTYPITASSIIWAWRKNEH